jgi:6-pyruvoyltetrahydropterin/6-carboxytetrahydropterin synthase
MFEISVKRTFRAAHALTRGGRPCEEPHEHLWACEATLIADGLHVTGVAADFREVDRALLCVVSEVEGKPLHEIEPLRAESPSAENVARHIYRRLARELDAPGARLAGVRVWEDPEHSAAYREGGAG